MSQQGPLTFAMTLLVLATAACSRSETTGRIYGDPLGGGGFGGDQPISGGGTGDGGFGPGGAGGFGPGGAGGFGPGGAGGFGPGGAGGFGPGGAGGGPCVVDAECVSPDACVTTRCSFGQCLDTERDEDRDGYVPAPCGGDDCNDLNPLSNPGQVERCADGSDNDCNGVSDCADPACAGQDCGCVVSPGGERCTNGTDDDCNGAVDCNDGACIGTPDCGCTFRESGGLCVNGIDDDCDGIADCDDGDCAFDPGCACVTAVELCAGGGDEDCDGLIDCADPSCSNDAACLCQPPITRERCDDVVDNDCDGLVDCADTDCTRSPVCDACGVEACSGGIDEDCDGAIDCADSGCRFDPACAPAAEICQNGIDDDRDGDFDCRDADCATNPACVAQHGDCLTALVVTASGSYVGDTTGTVGEIEGQCGGAAGEAVFRLVLSVPTRVVLDTIGSSFDTALYVRRGSCTAGREIGCDDDGGGVAWSSALDFPTLQPGSYFVFVDGYAVDPLDGPDEGAYVLNVDLQREPQEDCDNRQDDDGDHYADCADPDCGRVPRCIGCVGGGQPGPELGSGACTNGLDDDCDGTTDCSDPDCNANPDYPIECCNGVDENGNGVLDDFACRCASDADCLFDEVCYVRSNGACGPRCGDFVGDVCAVVAPGSVCNAATNQCEF